MNNLKLQSKVALEYVGNVSMVGSSNMWDQGSKYVRFLWRCG